MKDPLSRRAGEGWGEGRTTTSWPGVAAGLLVSSIAAYQLFKLPPVLPDYLLHYPVSPSLAALYMSIYSLIGIVVSRPIGRWLDRAGMSRPLLWASALFAMGCLAALWRPGVGVVFLLARGLEGLAFAICAIAGPIIAARSTRPKDLPLVTGLIAGWVPLGQIAAGAATALMPDWRFPWLLGLALALCLGALGWGGVGSSAGQAEPAALPGRSLSSAIVRRRMRGHYYAAAMFMLWSIQFMAFMTWLPSMAAIRFGLDLREGTGAYLLPVVFILIFNVLTGWALGRGLPLLGTLAGALVLQALVWALSPFLAGSAAIAALLVYGVGAGIAPACFFHLPHYVEGGRAGATGFGILMLGRNLGGFAGPLLLPALVEFQAEPPLGLAWFALITLGGMALVAGLGRESLREPAGSRPDR